jgi:glycerol-1-phosphate dehydrogenase [NAD(P)+]
LSSATVRTASVVLPTEVGLGGVLLGSGVLDRVAETVAEFGGEVALLADGVEMAGPHGEVKQTVAAALEQVRRVTLSGRVVADEATIERAAAGAHGAAVLVSVGSGTIADIGKAVSARLALPHVIVQTAASVNGFSDDQSVLLVDGVKRTALTRWPDRLLIDLDVIARAPAELNRAGLGDQLAVCTAPADWRLAQLVGQDDSYSAFAVSLARSHLDAVLGRADAVPRAELEDLCRALTFSGLAMGVAGTTAPCSGFEHTVSHLLEMAGARPLHGAGVGALTVLAAMLWERVRTVARAGGLRALRFPTAAEMEPRVRAAFAERDLRSGDACWRAYAAKLDRWNARRDELTTLWERWPDAEFDGLLASPERLVAALRAARAPVRLTQLGVRDVTARWALAHGHLMRDRFTVADLAFFMGIWEDSDVDALLVSAARLGAGL